MSANGVSASAAAAERADGERERPRPPQHALPPEPADRVESEATTTASVPRAPSQPPLRIDAGQDGDPDDPEADAGEPHPGRALPVREAQREERDEDRHRRVPDRRDARVDVRLAPGDEHERHRVLHDAERDRPRSRRAAPLRTRRARPGLHDEDTRQHDRPDTSRPQATTTGEKSRSPTLMNMNDAPQMSASTTSRGT